MSTLARTPAPIAAPRHAPASPASFVAVVRQLLWISRRSPLTWGGGLGAMSALMAAMWPSIEGTIGELADEYPPALKRAFGITHLHSLAAYVDAEMLSIIVPLAVVLLVVRGVVGATAGAEERGHLDVLLTLPLSRRVLAAGAYLTTGAIAASGLVLAWAMTCVAGLAVGAHVDAGALAAGFAEVWPLSMAFGGLGLLAVGCTSRAAVATGVAAGTAVAMYAIDLVGKMAPSMGALRDLSAFRLYGTAVRDGLVVSHVAILLAAGVVLAAAGALLFDRRDLR